MITFCESRHCRSCSCNMHDQRSHHSRPANSSRSLSRVSASVQLLSQTAGNHRDRFCDPKYHRDCSQRIAVSTRSLSANCGFIAIALGKSWFHRHRILQIAVPLQSLSRVAASVQSLLWITGYHRNRIRKSRYRRDCFCKSRYSSQLHSQVAVFIAIAFANCSTVAIAFANCGIHAIALANRQESLRSHFANRGIHRDCIRKSRYHCDHFASRGIHCDRIRELRYYRDCSCKSRHPCDCSHKMPGIIAIAFTSRCIHCDRISRIAVSFLLLSAMLVIYVVPCVTCGLIAVPY